MMRSKTLTYRLATIVILLSFGCSRTPSIKGYERAYASLEVIEINGDEQHLLIRTQDIKNPVLLFLHGGPGMPMMYMAHKFQEELESEFTVVQWDQRASGKSYRSDIDAEKIRVSQYLSDARVVVDYLREKFDKDKIILAGHSWGTYLGTLLIYEDPSPYHAYVGIGQVVDGEDELAFQRKFLESEAQKRKDKKAQEELAEYGEAIFEKYLFKYGGELKHKKSYWPFIWAGLGSPEYSIGDIGKVAKGSSFCSAHMTYDVIDKSLMDEEIYRFDLPVYYFTGTNDYTTPFELIEAYHDKVQAPTKKLVWFTKSAHFPFFEEPEKFAIEMLEIKKALKCN